MDTPSRLSTSIITAQLRPSESLLWSGSAGTGIRLTQSDWLMIPFSLLWCGFAIFWEYSALTIINTSAKGNGLAILFPVWGVPFVLIGLYSVFGRFFADAKRRAGAAYGITNQRIIISQGLFARTTLSLDIHTIPSITEYRHRDATWTLSFGPLYPGQRNSSLATFEFISPTDREQVLNALEQARSK